MELLFKVNDETKLGKVILDMIHSAIKQDNKSVKFIEEDFMDKVIFPGEPLTEEQMEILTLVMEQEGDYITLDEAKKETMAFLKKKRNEIRNKKKS